MLNGTLSVISSDPPWTLIFNLNVEDTDVFLTRKVFDSYNFSIASYKQEMLKSLSQKKAPNAN